MCHSASSVFMTNEIPSVVKKHHQSTEPEGTNSKIGFKIEKKKNLANVSNECFSHHPELLP